MLACLDASVAVGGIASSLGDFSPSLVSHHLPRRRAARIVKAHRHGEQVFYVAADQHISGMVSDLLEHIAELHSETD